MPIDKDSENKLRNVSRLDDDLGIAMQRAALRLAKTPLECVLSVLDHLVARIFTVQADIEVLRNQIIQLKVKGDGNANGTDAEND